MLAPLFRGPAPVLYFRSFFCPALTEVIKIHFLVNNRVKTMLIDLKNLIILAYLQLA